MDRHTVVQVLITDACGKAIKQMTKELNKGLETFSVPVGDLPSGAYFVNLIRNTGEMQTTSFVK